MDIINLTQEFIAKYRDNEFKKGIRLYSLVPLIHESAWRLGWNAAIKFSKKVNKAYGICEPCGKLVMSEFDLCTDADNVMFCKKCYEKVFCSNPIFNVGDIIAQEDGFKCKVCQVLEDRYICDHEGSMIVVAFEDQELWHKLLCWNDMSEEEKSDFFYDLSHQK